MIPCRGQEAPKQRTESNLPNTANCGQAAQQFVWRSFNGFRIAGRFAQSLYDCGVGAQASHLAPPTHALAEGSSDTCSPKDNRPDLNLQRVLTI